MGSLVMVGVGPLQPLACAIFPGHLPWAGKTGIEHWEKLHTNFFVVGLERLAVEKKTAVQSCRRCWLRFLHT